MELILGRANFDANSLKWKYIAQKACQGPGRAS